MSVPESKDLLDGNDELASDSQVARLVNVASDYRAEGGYWRGRCDGLELLVTYLKVRLDEIEARLDAGTGSPE